MLLSDARVIRAVAAPLRQQLLDALDAVGPCAVTDLADLLDRPADRLYYHLRILQRLGLVRMRRAQPTRGRPQAVYDVVSRPVQLEYVPRNEANAAAVSAVVGSMLRSAWRSFRRALRHGAPVVEGPRRDLWAARRAARLSPADLEQINGHLTGVLEILIAAGKNRRDLPVYEFAFVLTPYAPKGREDGRPRKARRGPGRGSRAIRNASLAALVASGLLSAGCGARPALPARAQPLEDPADVMRRLERFGFSGQVAISLGGELLLSGAYGIADREAGRRFSRSTLNDIGSIAKTYTAATVLALEADGLLQVSDSIGRFFPATPADKRAITVQQLLTHTSGLLNQYGEQGGLAVRQKDEFLTHILHAPLHAPPGSQFLYSDAGYELLAAIVEAVTGRGFCAFMHDRILHRAGLRQTGCLPEFLAHAGDDVARGYETEGAFGRGVAVLSNRAQDSWFQRGSGHMVSTAEELVRWVEALASGRVLPPAQTARMFQGQALATGFGSGVEYGYGWFVQQVDGRAVAHHGGGFIGFTADLRWYRDDGIITAVISNDRPSGFPTAYRVSRELLPPLLYGGPDPGLPPGLPAVPALLSPTLAGIYLTSAGGRVHVTVDSTIRLQGDGQDVTSLFTMSPDESQDAVTLNARAAAVMERVLAGDTAALAQVIPEGTSAREWKEMIRAELVGMERVHGALQRTTVLGTTPRRSALNVNLGETFVRLSFASGEETYRLVWRGGRLEGTDWGIPFPATVFCQAASATTLHCYDLRHARPILAYFDKNAGEGWQLHLQAADGDLVATRLR